MTSKKLLQRIDEKNYLTEREHREYLQAIEKDLEELEIQRKYNAFLEKEIEHIREQLQKARKEKRRFKNKYLTLKEELKK